MVNNKDALLFFYLFCGTRVVRVIKLHVFTFLVPCYDVHCCTYWCLTRFRYQIIFMSFNRNMTGATWGAGTSNPFRAHEFTRSFFLLCGRFTSVAAMLYQSKQNVEQELLSFQNTSVFCGFLFINL